MSLALEERPRELELGGSGGAPARRAIFRWSWRLFRREWRQQVLVVALVVFAVAATTVGVALAYNAGLPVDSAMGTATGSITFAGPSRADLEAARQAFGTIEEIDHQTIVIPGIARRPSTSARRTRTGRTDVPTLRLVSGRFPTGPADIAMTGDAAAAFGVHIGDSFTANGASRRVVGLVENPLDLNDEFALVAPGQADPPAQVTILFDASAATGRRVPPTGQHGGHRDPLDREQDRDRGRRARVRDDRVVVRRTCRGGGFRGHGAASTPRSRACSVRSARPTVRFASRWSPTARVVGVVGAVAGAVLGLATWIALAPRFESLVNHRVEPIPPAVVGDRGRDGPRDRDRDHRGVVAGAFGGPIIDRRRAVGPAGATQTCAPVRRRRSASFWRAGSAASRSRMRNVQNAEPGAHHRRDGRYHLRDVVRRAAVDPRTGGGGPARADRVATRVARSRSLPSPLGGRARRDQSRARDRGDRRHQRGRAPRFPRPRRISRTTKPSSIWAPGTARVRPVVLHQRPQPSAAQIRTLQPRVDALAASLHAQAVVPLAEAARPRRRGNRHRRAFRQHRHTRQGATQSRTGSVTASRSSDEMPLYVATPALLAHYGIKPSDINPNDRRHHRTQRPRRLCGHRAPRGSDSV